MTKFMQIQINKIKIDKWCEGCRIQADPGPAFIMDWIQTNGHWFRTTYDNSICQSCQHWQRCGHTLQPTCAEYEAE
ncbi:MAG TPA: hypothetical protein PKI62_16235 [bacterium]|nr:hypothetical protein [bacterium]HPR88802.1 hypothetical protein [bacterium]